METLDRIVELWPSLSHEARQENEDEAFDLLEELRRLAGSVGWEPLLADAFAILNSQAQKGFWYQAILVFFWSLSSQPTLPCTLEECIARLYVCLEQSPELDEHDSENLIWSIVHHLKGISYLSDWDPYKDPRVWKHMERYRQET